MKTCPECGHNNELNADFCKVCGRNLKSNIAKTTNKPVIKDQLLYKVDKKSGQLRISKTKAISLFSFSFIFLFCILIGLSSHVALWAFALVGFLFGSLIALVLYVLGYGIAGLIEKFDL